MLRILRFGIGNSFSQGRRKKESEWWFSVNFYFGGVGEMIKRKTARGRELPIDATNMSHDCMEG